MSMYNAVVTITGGFYKGDTGHVLGRLWPLFYRVKLERLWNEVDPMRLVPVWHVRENKSED